MNSMSGLRHKLRRMESERFIFRNSDEIKPILTSHGVGLKQVL